MKSITEIIAGAQILLGIRFELQDCFEQYLDEDHRAFLAMLRAIEEHLPELEPAGSRMGRPAYRRHAFLRAFLAQRFFRLDSAKGLRKRLRNDSNLRQICGFRNVPSAATFSRRLAELADSEVVSQSLDGMIRHYHQGKLVGHISRDSTAIEARERPANKKQDVAIVAKPSRKRGRPRKGERREVKSESRLERQLQMDAAEAVAELNRYCAWGCKKNSQGNVSFWKGYKLHLDVTDVGIPVTAVVTGANVHDSQLAIPMEKCSEGKLTFLYSLMDSAYDAAAIAGYIEGRGRVALIDANKRRGEAAPRQFTPAQKERFKIRTTVERANAHLKDWLIPQQLFVRGVGKVSFQLLCGVLCLAALKILQYYVLPAYSGEG